MNRLNGQILMVLILFKKLTHIVWHLLRSFVNNSVCADDNDVLLDDDDDDDDSKAPTDVFLIKLKSNKKILSYFYYQPSHYL